MSNPSPERPTETQASTADQVAADPVAADQAAAQALAQGQALIEGGNYNAAVAVLTSALDYARPLSALHGEIQIWLITAYQGLGEYANALELCSKLQKHPDKDTRDQAKQLLYVLEAPRLAAKPEWTVEIPDLAALEGAEAPRQWSRGGRGTREPEPVPWIPEPPDPSQVNLNNEPFLWMAIAALLGAIAGIWALG